MPTNIITRASINSVRFALSAWMDVEARLRIEIHVVPFASEKVGSREKLSRNVTGDSRSYADDHVRTEGIR